LQVHSYKLISHNFLSLFYCFLILSFDLLNFLLHQILCALEINYFLCQLKRKLPRETWYAIEAKLYNFRTVSYDQQLNTELIINFLWELWKRFSPLVSFIVLSSKRNIWRTKYKNIFAHRRVRGRENHMETNTTAQFVNH
jgi:hypothetical protein